MTDRLRLVTEQEPTRRQPMAIAVLSVWRCPTCGRILAKLRLTPGSVVEIKCGVCNTIATKEAA